jgi:hypothetical protein
MDGPSGFECCFCGQHVEETGHDPVVLTITIADANADESQGLYCHGRCLKSHLRPGIPTLMDAHDSV